MSLIFAPAGLTSRFLGALIERLDDTWGLALAGEAGVALAPPRR